MKYYTCANTSSGVADFTEDNIKDIGKKVLLKCKNNLIKDAVLRRVGNGFGEYDEIFCCGSNKLISGIISTNNEVAIVDKCSNYDKLIDLDLQLGINNCEELNELYTEMFKAYAEAKIIHDQWEKIYISNMDFASLDKFYNEVIDKLTDVTPIGGIGENVKRFFGTSTISGPVNFIDNITENISKRYFIKGRPGTGKSTFLKKLSAKLKSMGYDVEEYYCSFDKESLDMVVCRQLSFCVFDSTPPHEKFPERNEDEILDFYIASGLNGVDEKFKKQLLEVKNEYDKKTKEGMSYFKKAWDLKRGYDITFLEKIGKDEIHNISKQIIQK